MDKVTIEIPDDTTLADMEKCVNNEEDDKKKEEGKKVRYIELYLKR